MIKVIFGKRGSGKTKRIIALAKQEAQATKGHVVFVEKDNRCMLDLPHDIRYVNAGEYISRNADIFFGFVSGMLAANFDIVDVFIDALPSIVGIGSDVELEAFFNKLKDLSDRMQVNFILSVSASGDEPPTYLEPYILH